MEIPSLILRRSQPQIYAPLPSPRPKSARMPTHAPQQSEAHAPPQSQAHAPSQSQTQAHAPPHAQIHSMPQTRFHSPPQTRFYASPQVQVHAPPQSQVNGPPQNQVHAPPQSWVLAPPENQVDAPPKNQVPILRENRLQYNTQASSAPNRQPEHLMHKNRLQEYCQRSSIPLPIYQTVNEDHLHSPRFRSTVLVDGRSYTSPNAFSQRKAAEQDAAKLALESLSKTTKDESGNINLSRELISQDIAFCKLILNEFAIKMNMQKGTYETIQSDGLFPVFVSTLIFNGVTYTGEAGKNKKEAEQLAARATILSLLGDSGYATSLSEVINSKVKLYASLHKVKDLDYTNHGSVDNKEAETDLVANNALAQVNAPTNAIGQTDHIPASVTAQTVSGAQHWLSILKMPNSEALSSQQISLPIEFVPQASEQRPLVPDSSRIGQTICMPVSINPQTVFGAQQQWYEFKMPNLEPSLSQQMSLPIKFVHQASEQQPLVPELSSSKKRRKNKKGANKKLQNGDRLPVATMSCRQHPPCSLAL